MGAFSKEGAALNKIKPAVSADPSTMWRRLTMGEDNIGAMDRILGGGGTFIVLPERGKNS